MQRALGSFRNTSIRIAGPGFDTVTAMSETVTFGSERVASAPAPAKRPRDSPEKVECPGPNGSPARRPAGESERTRRVAVAAGPTGRPAAGC